MQQAVTAEQLKNLHNSIEKGGVKNVIQAYDYLYQRGYNYAGWAKGVATGNTISGIAALSYLENSAQSGLRDAQINQIRVDMAKKTLNEYQRIAADNNGILSRDLDYKEVKFIHAKVFEDKTCGTLSLGRVLICML